MMPMMMMVAINGDSEGCGGGDGGGAGDEVSDELVVTHGSDRDDGDRGGVKMTAMMVMGTEAMVMTAEGLSLRVAGIVTDMNSYPVYCRVPEA